jgi:hypothetical protein
MEATPTISTKIVDWGASAMVPSEAKCRGKHLRRYKCGEDAPERHNLSVEFLDDDILSEERLIVDLVIA